MDRVKISDQIFDLERSLYNAIDTDVINCKFAGVHDGESVLKETRNCVVKECEFSLRYPLWHAENFVITKSKMDELTRAPIWYSHNGVIDNCIISGVKCLRECSNISINNSVIDSVEFGWRCQNVSVDNSQLQSEYLFFECKNLNIKKMKMKGKYSFQYVQNMNISDSVLDTKDAFWHTENVTVKNSIINGEYLGWFSNNLTLIDCQISGTQPFCYCNNLKMINCTMTNCDLSFEYSECDCQINGCIESIKNPKSGLIVCDEVKEIIFDHATIECFGKVEIRKKDINN